MDYKQLYKNKDDSYYAHQRTELLPFIPNNIKTALDVGCGKGGFGALLKNKFNCTVWGVEPDVTSAGEAANNLDRVITGLFPVDIKQFNGITFDAIFFNDVLEHMPDPEQVLSSCHSLLNKGGCIVASIPNIRWYPVILSLLRYRDFKYQEGGVMDKTHLRFFTKKSMIRLFESSGYEVVTIEGINKSKFKVFDFINLLLFKTQNDMSYPQFAVVSKLKNGHHNN